MKAVTYMDEQSNALAQAIGTAAGADDWHDDAVYDFFETTPRTSLVMFTVEALNELGFEITKKQP